MAASTTIVRAGDKSHKFSWDLINQANPSHLVAAVQRRTDIGSENVKGLSATFTSQANRRN